MSLHSDHRQAIVAIRACGGRTRGLRVRQACAPLGLGQPLAAATPAAAGADTAAIAWELCRHVPETREWVRLRSTVGEGAKTASHADDTNALRLLRHAATPRHYAVTLELCRKLTRPVRFSRNRWELNGLCVRVCALHAWQFCCSLGALKWGCFGVCRALGSAVPTRSTREGCEVHAQETVKTCSAWN